MEDQQEGAMTFKNSGEMYRFAAYEASKDPIPSWHSMLPALEGKAVASSQMAATFDGASDIVEKAGGHHLPEMLFDAENCDLYD